MTHLLKRFFSFLVALMLCFTLFTSTDTTSFQVNATSFFAPSSSVTTFCSASSSTLSAPKVTLSNLKNGIKVRWNTVKGAKNYIIYRKIGNSLWHRLGELSSTAVSYTDTSAKSNGTKYQYLVTAENSSAYTPSDIATIYFLTRGSIKKISTKNQTLSTYWNTNSKATSYQICYSSGSTSKIYTSSKQYSGQTISKLQKDNTYAVKVRSCKTVSNVTYYSAWSPVKNITIK